MRRILNNIVSRGFSTRPMINHLMSFSHPEMRRTFPVIYFNWKEAPQIQIQDKDKDKEIDSKDKLYTGRKPLNRRESLRHLTSSTGRTVLTDMSKWAEFRRKIIYGTY